MGSGKIIRLKDMVNLNTLMVIHMKENGIEINITDMGHSMIIIMELHMKECGRMILNMEKELKNYLMDLFIMERL